jgi:hypothetical protein
MLPLEKKICRICFFSILLSVISVLTPQSLSIAMLILAVHLYFSFFIRSVYKELHTNHGTGLLTTNKG